MNSDVTRHSRWPIFLAVLTAVVGMGLSLHFRSRLAQTEATTARLTAETLRLNTEQELTLFAEVLESVRAMHALSDAVNQAAMDEFIEKGLVHQHDVLGAFGLAQRITPHVRSLLEKEAEEQGTGYRVIQEGSDGAWVAADPKAVYYPLTWQTHSEALNIPIGFDFSSLTNALHTIKQIERTHRTTLVPYGEGIRLEALGLRERSGVRSQESGVRGQESGVRGQESGVKGQKSEVCPSNPTTLPNRKSEIGNPRYWVFSPIIPRNNPNAVIGFSVAVLHPDAILKRVAAQSALSPKLRLNLISPANFNPGETIQLANGAWIYRHPLKALGAQWMFECSLPITGSVHRSTATLVIGLIITALMTSQLLILGNRTRKIEAEVLARTEDLRIANVHLGENLRERAHMEEEMNELATRERRRIGRDLHDSLGQKLTGAVFLSRSLLDYLQGSGVRSQGSGVRSQGSGVRGQESGVRSQESGVRSQRSEIKGQESANSPSNPQPATQTPSSGEVPDGRGGFKEQATVLNETLKSAVTQVRNMARGLSPVALNDESLSEALQQLVEEMRGLYSVSCEVSYPTAARSESLALPGDSKSKGGATSPTEPNRQEPHSITSLSQKTKEQLYLITREAVNNAARHAQAHRVTVQLTGNDSGWKLRIEDDGKGLPSAQPSEEGSPCSGSEALREGMGIRIMRHRARLIGAGFTITSVPESGTCITVEGQTS